MKTTHLVNKIPTFCFFQRWQMGRTMSPRVTWWIITNQRHKISQTQMNNSTWHSGNTQSESLEKSVWGKAVWWMYWRSICQVGTGERYCGKSGSYMYEGNFLIEISVRFSVLPMGSVENCKYLAGRHWLMELCEIMLQCILGAKLSGIHFSHFFEILHEFELVKIV